MDLERAKKKAKKNKIKDEEKSKNCWGSKPDRLFRILKARTKPGTERESEVVKKRGRGMSAHSTIGGPHFEREGKSMRG